MRRILSLLLLVISICSFIYGQEVVSGDITSDVTLSSSKTYLLRGFVRVQSGATLTIEPGTIIYGEYSSQGTLIIKPGGKIKAIGTAASPIVFTSEFNKAGSSQAPTYGDWGGVIILGNAPINVAGGTAAIEGPGDSYGGTDEADNSGTMKYVRIEYPGIAFSPNNEINGLTFGGVGSGTTIDYIQVSYSGDDSYEWFGGSVNCKHLIAYRGLDDDFDTDFGFHGKLQFLVAVRDPQVADVVSGSNGFESDNDGSGSTNEPRTSPTWWNVTLVGPAATTSSSYSSDFKRGMHLRRSSQNKINNAIIMGYPTGILVDGANTVTDAQSGVMYVKNSIISGSVTANFASTDAAFQTDMPTWFANSGGRTYTANTEVLLADPFNLDSPNPMPKSGSPVLTGAGTPPADGFFDATANYVGAFGYTDWTKGWSTFSITVPEKEEGTIAGDITSDMTLTADKDYKLVGFVRVQSGATLTIEPGTKIYGDYASQGTLIIKPGGKIKAIGTAASPIVFTSEFNKPTSSQTPTYGDWGGVIILGNAPINVAGGTAAIEGPGDSYGGTDEADNSGTMKYVRIEYPGIAFSPNNEINGLTFGGVGSGTTIDYIQVSYSGDDSYEWFGGSVNCKHLIAYRGLDDDFDTDFGFHGKLQFLVAVRDPQVADVVSGSNGFESDNDGSGSTNEPRTSPTWWNVTLVGPAATTSSSYSSDFKRGMHLRRSSQNKINNAIIMGYPTGILVDGANTVTDAQSGVMYVKNSIISGSVTANFASTDAAFQTDMPTWFANSGGRTYTANTEVLLADPFNLDSPNPMPKSGSPVLTGAGTPPADGFFDATANYVGAFGYTDWTKGWSTFSITVPEKEEGTIAGDITSDMTLTADKDYKLVGFVRVQSGATLTIEPGTKIYGDYASQGTLIIKPGGKIKAIGTAASPIVFTSEFNKPTSSQTPTYGDWGGVIILGNAPINVAGGTAAIEGPGDSYGGTDEADNSGTMKYVRIEYPGIAFSPNNEINGLTFGGVGSGTTIDYIQVSYSGDDSYEWFGGSVNCKHLIAYRGLDDDFDTDFGFHGKLQFLVAVRDPQVADVVSGSNGFESDNDGSGSTNEPRTSPTWWNVTLVGPAATTSSSYSSDFKRGMHLRRSSQNKINNTIVMGYPTGILVDGANTVTDAQSGVMYVKNSIISGSVTANFASTDAAFQTDMPTWFANNGGRTYADNAELLLADPFNLDNPNPMPKSGSPVLTGAGTPPADGFFDATADYVGAFKYTNWTENWSSLSITAPVSVKEEQNSGIPKEYNLSQNYPNPFNPSTTISFSLPKAEKVSLRVYNILGEQVADLINGNREAGYYNVTWNASNISSGIYIYRLEAGSNVISKKMTLLK